MLLHIGTTDASSVTMTASCLCAMLIDLTSEEFLLSRSDFDAKTLGSLSELILRSLQQVISLYSIIGIILFWVIVHHNEVLPLHWVCWLYVIMYYRVSLMMMGSNWTRSRSLYQVNMLICWHKSKSIQYVRTKIQLSLRGVSVQVIGDGLIDFHMLKM